MCLHDYMHVLTGTSLDPRHGTAAAAYFCPSLADTYGDMEVAGWNVLFKWVPSDVGMPGNEVADRLTSSVHNDDDPSVLLRRFAEAERLIEDIIRLQHADERVAREAPLLPV